MRSVLTIGLCLGLGGCASPPTNPEPKIPDAAVAPGGDAAAEAADHDTGGGSVQDQPDAEAPVDDSSAGQPETPDAAGTGGDGEATVAQVDPETSAGTNDSATTQPASTQPKTKAEPSLPPPLYKSVDKSCGQDPGVNTQAKAMALPTTSGKTIDLQSYRRRVVLLNFWGTWCKPCLKELPEFSRLYRRYRKYGLTLIAVATDEESEKVDEFIKERKIAGKILIKGQKLADDYRSPNFPFSFVIAPGGNITGSYRRYRPECMGKLEQDIRNELLKLQR